MTDGQDSGPEQDSIPQLQDFELPPDPGFEGRVWRSIDRRETAGSFLDLCTRGPVSLFLEYLAALLGIVSTRDEDHEQGLEE